MFPHNPYITGNPVGNTEVFVGREELLKAVEAIVVDPHKNAIMLYGQRRVSKTSVLQKLQVRLAERGQTIFFDLQNKDSYSWKEIKQELVREVNDTLGRTDVTPEGLEQWFVNQNTLLIFLIDEFNVLLVKNSKIHDESLQELSKLLAINPQHVKWVFTSSSKIEDLPDAAISFRDILFEIISPLSQSETQELVRLAEKNQTLQWSAAAMDQVWQFTGGHPFLTQRLCSFIWDYIIYEKPSQSMPTVGYKDVEKIARGDKFIDPGNQVLNELWRQLSDLERLILCFSVPGKGNFFEEWLLSGFDKADKVVAEIRDKIQRTLNSLKQWGWLNNELRFRVELVRIWVEKYQLSSYQKWLQSFLGERLDKIQFNKINNFEKDKWLQILEEKSGKEQYSVSFKKLDILSRKQNQSDEKEQLSVLHLLVADNVEATVTDVRKTSEQLPPGQKKKLIQYLPKYDLVEPYSWVYIHQPYFKIPEVHDKCQELSNIKN